MLGELYSTEWPDLTHDSLGYLDRDDLDCMMEQLWAEKKGLAEKPEPLNLKPGPIKWIDNKTGGQRG